MPSGTKSKQTNTGTYHHEVIEIVYALLAGKEPRLLRVIVVEELASTSFLLT
jgi:hypothetical protein